MAVQKTEAILLKSWNFRETSKLLSFYTRDFGKVKMIAKGARSPKSPLKGRLESLCHLQLVYYHKQTRDLQLLTQAETINPHLQMFGHFEKTTLGLAVAELLDKGVAAQDVMPPLFDLLRNALEVIDRSSGFTEGAVWYFETHFIDLMGYKPTWDACLKCGNPLSMQGGFFQAQNGGLLCHDCGSRYGGLQVGGETLEILFWLQKAQPDESIALDPDPGRIAEIRKMFDLYFRTHIEQMRTLKALKLYYGMTLG